MSFAAPLVLLGLLALPVLAVLYVSEQRRRRAASRPFATPALQPSVAAAPARVAQARAVDRDRRWRSRR